MEMSAFSCLCFAETQRQCLDGFFADDGFPMLCQIILGKQCGNMFLTIFIQNGFQIVDGFLGGVCIALHHQEISAFVFVQRRSAVEQGFQSDG